MANSKRHRVAGITWPAYWKKNREVPATAVEYSSARGIFTDHTPLVPVVVPRFVSFSKKFMMMTRQRAAMLRTVGRSYIEKTTRTGQARCRCHDAGGADGRVLERAAAFGSVGQRSAGQLALL